MKKYNNVNSYISSFPEDIQGLLRSVQDLITENAPNAVEGISYGMPAYKINGKPFIYFAGFKKHIGLYATPNTHTKFSKELSKYKHGKGSVQFPTDKDLP